jgi:hypothetical protein
MPRRTSGIGAERGQRMQNVLKKTETAAIAALTPETVYPRCPLLFRGRSMQHMSSRG